MLILESNIPSVLTVVVNRQFDESPKVSLEGKAPPLAKSFALLLDSALVRERWGLSGGEGSMQSQRQDPKRVAEECVSDEVGQSSTQQREILSGTAWSLGLR